MRTTPLHEFWAQLASMFQRQSVVKVISIEAVTIFAALFCLLVFGLMLFCEMDISLGVLLASALFLPTLNGLAIELFNVYLPVFPLLYFGFWTLVLSSFVKVFHHQQLQNVLEQRNVAQDNLNHLKANFISLVSHNLKTPIAKLQGLVDIILAMPITGPMKSDFASAQKIVEKLDLSAKAILVTTALEEGEVDNTQITLSSLLQDVDENLGRTLKKLGIEGRFLTKYQYEDHPFRSVRINVKALSCYITGLCSMLEDLREVVIECNSQEDHDGNLLLELRVIATDSWLSRSHLAALASQQSRGFAYSTAENNTLVGDVICGLVYQLLKMYRGQFKLIPRGKGGEINLALSLA
jgi:signal transduction histidine kinase